MRPCAGVGGQRGSPLCPLRLFVVIGSHRPREAHDARKFDDPAREGHEPRTFKIGRQPHDRPTDPV